MEVTLNSVRETTDNVLRIMTLYKGNYPWVIFYVDLEKYPIFKVAKNGHKFTIIGTINSIEGNSFEIEVEEILE